MQSFDYIVIGQGLAGTTIAWQLRMRGKRVAIVDRNESATASRIAAGLISPLTGQRNAVSWRFDELWPVAKQFYQQLENQLDRRFLHLQPLIRVLLRDQSLEANSPSKSFIGANIELPRPLSQDYYGVEFQPAARLDVSTFLDASRESFAADDGYFIGDLDLAADISLDAESVTIDPVGVRGKRLILCNGIAATRDFWFPDVKFEPAKGEILTVEIDGMSDERVFNGDAWLAPTRDGRFRVGATYNREFVDAQPTENGHDEIIKKLTTFLDGTANVVDHQAAIRPIVQGRRPVVGMHPTHQQLGYFNGLGSKGALRAPWVAQQFAEFLTVGTPVPSDICLRTRLNRPNEFPSSRKLTEQAQDCVTESVVEGDVVIDATAGNGYDTLFLARLVSGNTGTCGRVFAIDRQAEAISRTRSRLADEKIENVTLIEASHAHLNDLIPKQDQGQIAAIMFNLGYLPRGDKQFTTEVNSTLRALRSSFDLLKPGGILTVLAYTGHEGGLEEAEAVESELQLLDEDGFQVVWPKTRLVAGPPRLYVVRSLRS